MLQTAEDIRLLNEKIKDAAGFVNRINDELSKTIVGQQGMIERLLIGLLSNGHILLEGVPGLGKTALNEYRGRDILPAPASADRAGTVAAFAPASRRRDRRSRPPCSACPA